MDNETLAAYDRAASDFAQEWADQPPPLDMYGLVQQYFHRGPTADIGCGSGRDAAWLTEHGYPVVGYDASDGLLGEARRLHPDLRFEKAVLPGLEGIEPGSFRNVLCETVIIHLDPSLVGPSVRRLLEILEPCGVLYLSWRVTPGADRRDEHGRLYSAFDVDLVFGELRNEQLLRDEEIVSESSGKVIRRLFVRKS